MVTAQDVHSVTFDKSMRGYHTEQVDQFLEQVASQIEQDAKRVQQLEKENAALKEKLYLLAQKIEEYRADEDNLKSALLNAQRMGENVVREAKQKADVIEREAKIRAEGIVSSAADRCKEERIEFERIRAEVSQFKANVLGLYRQHIESLSTLPEEEPAEPVQKPAEDYVEQPAAEPAAAAPVEAAEPAVAEAEEVAAVQEPEQSDDFWEQEMTLEPVQPEETEAPAAQPAAAAPGVFQGIRFSD